MNTATETDVHEMRSTFAGFHCTCGRWRIGSWNGAAGAFARHLELEEGIELGDYFDPEPWVDQDGHRWSYGKRAAYLALGSTFEFAYRPRPRFRHQMLPGSHEWPGTPTCRCGATYDRWNDRCTARGGAA